MALDNKESVYLQGLSTTIGEWEHKSRVVNEFPLILNCFELQALYISWKKNGQLLSSGL